MCLTLDIFLWCLYGWGDFWPHPLFRKFICEWGFLCHCLLCLLLQGQACFLHRAWIPKWEPTPKWLSSKKGDLQNRWVKKMKQQPLWPIATGYGARCHFIHLLVGNVLNMFPPLTALFYCIHFHTCFSFVFIISLMVNIQTNSDWWFRIIYWIWLHFGPHFYLDFDLSLIKDGCHSQKMLRITS